MCIAPPFTTRVRWCSICSGACWATMCLFKGMRRFYDDSRFTKVGTENFRQAMETASGRSLERFFERWIYNSTLPRVSFSYRIETTSGPGRPNGSSGQSAVLRIEQAGSTPSIFR